MHLDTFQLIQSIPCLDLIVDGTYGTYSVIPSEIQQLGVLFFFGVFMALLLNFHPWRRRNLRSVMSIMKVLSKPMG